ncbi:MAG: helix-turn-helix domain-containing protein [Pseudomonadales bacterium]
MTAAIPSRRERKKLALREKIASETLSLIALHGVEGTTIDAICDCSDIAKKTFYNYYSSKHDLLIDICQQQLLDRSAELVQTAISADTRLSQRLRHIIGEAKLRTLQAGKVEKQLIDYMVGNLSANMNQGAGQLTQMNQGYYRLFSDCESQLRPGLNAEFCAEVTVGMMNALTLNWLHDDSYDINDRYDHLLNYLLESMIQQH